MLIPRAVLLELDQMTPSTDGAVRLASVDVDLDPLDLVRAGVEAFGWAGFYSSPDGPSIGGLGRAVSLSTSGPGRLDDLAVAIADHAPGAPFLTGFSFDDHGPTGVDWEGFGAATAVLPEVAIVRSGGRSRMTVAIRPGSDGRLLMGLLSALRPPAPVVGTHEVDHTVESRPLASDWRDLVSEAIDVIAAGGFEKVVLARSVRVRTPGRPAAFDLVSRLRDLYPECRVFGWQEGDGVFIGASPELLVASEGERFRLSPLAGSAPRGVDGHQDRLFGEALLASAKDRHEHALVVDDAVARVRPLASTVDHPSEPILQRFATVQHLATPISGHSDRPILDLAAALHPTPAVGGTPRADALAFIAKQEGVDRGWYSGGIGWADPSGDGELAVALRCALVTGDHAIAYAGNGIVAGSDPDRELTETRLKLRPMLDLLTGR
jgi:salicylate biosynthesis isochorismate synthase